MSRRSAELDLSNLKVLPLAERRSLTSVDDILLDPATVPMTAPANVQRAIDECAGRIREARERGAAVMLVYGAHLLRNGAARILDGLMERGWLTHLATNGAGTIHDWEYAWLGKSTESVEDGVTTGTFGTWDETGRWIHLALLTGGIAGEGYGEALGRLLNADGLSIPTADEMTDLLVREPAHPLAAARADMLRAITLHHLQPGWQPLAHRYKYGSILASAYRHDIPLSVHPGIGYDIISNHPMFNGAVIGRAGQIDFRKFCHSVENLDGGVVLSVGSAIMGPQVFEKALSCVHNLRFQTSRPAVAGHSITVVDLQDGGNWDWSRGEPPKSNPAYYLRFCKSYSRMGGAMQYLQFDNAAFVQHLAAALNS